MRRAARVDANQGPIVKELRSIPGVTVEVGHDDILVGHRGRTYWFEIKSDGAVSRRSGNILDSRKQDGQRELEERWRGHYRVVATLDEILQEIGLTRGDGRP